MKLRVQSVPTYTQTFALAVTISMVLTSVSWAQQSGRNRQRTSIDSWKFLAEKYDKNNDAKISSIEYTRSEETFSQLDANQDGVLSADDWAGNSARSRRGGGGNRGATAPKQGSIAPDFELTEIRNAESKISLSSFAGKKPVALIFGSCTWPPFVASVGQLKELHQKYENEVQFFVIYCREAHPVDSARPARTPVEQPVSTAERRQVAEAFLEEMNLEIPSLLDNIDDKTGIDYAGHPDRLYLVGKDGKIAFAGEKGPRGFKPDLLEEAILIETGKKKASTKNETSETAPPNNGMDERMQRMLQRLPLIAALDADGNGEISSQELENSVTALNTLDKNGDEKISSDELRPARRERGRGRRQ